MSLPEHVIEEWARQALSRMTREELRRAIAEVIEALESITEEVEEIETAASEAGGILDAVAYDLDSVLPEEIYGPLADTFAVSIEEALEYIEALTYVNEEDIISDIVAVIRDYLSDLFPIDEIIDAISSEIRENTSEISASAERLLEVVSSIYSVFEHLYYEEEGPTEDEVNELVKRIEEVVEKLVAIHDLYLNSIITAARKLVEILRQLDEHLTQTASEE